MNSNSVLSFKLLIIGAAGVGKSCLLHNVVDSTFPINDTVDYDRFCPIVAIYGQAMNTEITKPCYETADGIILMYDVTNNESYDHVLVCLEEIRNSTKKNVIKILVGNKSDLVGKRVVKNETAKEFADNHKIPFLETSASVSEIFKETFMTLTEMIKKSLFPAAAASQQKPMRVTLKRQFSDNIDSNFPIIDTVDSLSSVYPDSNFPIIDTVDSLSSVYPIVAIYGQAKNPEITKPYYESADGIIVMYDVTNKASYDHVLVWLEEIQKSTKKNVIKILVGNKLDLVGKRVVKRETAKVFADNNKIPFIETSASVSENFKETFMTLTEMIKKSLFPAAAASQQKPKRVTLKRQSLDNITQTVDLGEGISSVNKDSDAPRKDLSMRRKTVHPSRSMTMDVGASVGLSICFFEISKRRREVQTDQTRLGPYFYSHENGYKLQLRVLPTYRDLSYKSLMRDISLRDVEVTLAIVKGQFDDSLRWPCEYKFFIAIKDGRAGYWEQEKMVKCDYGSDDDSEHPDHWRLVPVIFFVPEYKGVYINERIYVRCVA